MKASLRALLTGVIDYAGLFPPAKLPLDEAIRNYARYRTEPESWMLGRFICPASQLANLEALLRDSSDPELGSSISVLGRSGKTPSEFLDGVKADVGDVIGFPAQTFASFETAVPAGLSDVNTLIQLLTVTVDSFARAKPLLHGCYFEVPMTATWRDALRAAVEAIIRTGNRTFADGFPRVLGLKFRCGGVESSAFPRVEDVAYFLRACKESGGIPFKFTAGLHHPFRHFNEGVRTRMHGFLNVLGAAVFLLASEMDENRLGEMLSDEDPGSFVFAEDGMTWDKVTVSVPEILAARQSRVGSFGSCSFDEPRDDLRALGLL